MKKFGLAVILLLCVSPCFGQSWANVLSTARAITWASQVGLPATFPDGETTSVPWVPPTRTQCTAYSGYPAAITGTGVPVTDLAALNNAITACAGSKGYIPITGNFSITGVLGVGGTLNDTLRGSGPQSTTIKIGSGGSIAIGLASGGGTCNVQSGSTFTQGSTSLICTGSTPTANQPAWIQQCDTGVTVAGCVAAPVDNGSVWICANYTICSNQTGPGGAAAHEEQNVLVTNVSGSCASICTITFTPGLFMSNWAYGQNPFITWNSSTYTAIGYGMEDMTLDFTSGASNFGSFTFDNAYASWIKGVEIIGPTAGGCCTLNLEQVGNSLFVNNYVVGFNPTSGTGGGLTIKWGADSGMLIMNTLMVGSTISEIEGGGLDSGNVLAYNYFRDSNSGQIYNGDAEHLGGMAFILREGNQFGVSRDDATWGTHNFDTWFRNDISCYDPPYIGSSSPTGILMDNWARFENAIGNIVNVSGACTSYKGTAGSAEFQFGSSDTLAQTTSMLWGNCDTINNTCRFVSSEVPSSLASPNAAYSNSVPGSNNLPCSFFLSTYTATTCTPKYSGGTGLSFWKVCTVWTTFPTSCSTTSTPAFPPAGPDVTGGPYVAGTGTAYDVPAAVAYKNLPVDTTRQNSYTITGSSWSSGTETLTVSGLPASTANLRGGFRFSGVNAACSPSSGVSYTGRSDGEIVMTGSSTTQIKYAITSNPGVSCTGTMLWPDVREFDERVYQNDPLGVILSPAPESFGSVNVGSSSSPVTFTLTNNSVATATSISPSVSGGNSGDFSITNSGAGSCSAASGSIAGGGASCTFTVTFTPGATGSRSTTLSVSYSGGDGASPQTSALSGTGNATGSVSLSPSSQNFGTVTIGASSATVTFTLSNTTASSVTSITVTNTGGNTADFVNANTGSCTSTLAASSSCTIIMKFSPSAIGSRSTTLNVADSASSSPQQSSLSGTGITSVTAPAVAIFGILRPDPMPGQTPISVLQ
jgi:hypothetical protein